MKTVLLSAALATLAIGCGETNVQGTLEPKADDPTAQVQPANPARVSPNWGRVELPEDPTKVDFPDVPTIPTAPSRQAHLRLRGAKIGSVDVAHLRADEVRILADGSEIPFKLELTKVDLAQAGHSWDVASFEVPEGAENIQVVLDVEDDAGSFRTDGEVGRIHAPGMPISLEAKADLILARGKLVVEMDLERSLVQTATGVRELVPTWRVDY